MQNKSLEQTINPPYFRKEEIIADGKRYRKHNNYLTAGPGYMTSSIRKTVQKAVGIDFQFHIRREHFQAGVLMSGEEFLSNNNIQLHLGYGYRREKTSSNLAAFVGPTYFSGVEGTPGVTAASFYSGFGAYACVQAITKFTYDIGFGLEAFGEISRKQKMAGIKAVFFFSGAYRGLKRNYNPNVRSENAR